MKLLLIICLICSLALLRSQAQSPPSQTFVLAGYPSVGIDYAKRITHKKWSSGMFSVSVSPNFYFRRFNFDDVNYSDSRFQDYRILVPMVLRYEFYPSQMLEKIGKKGRIGVFADVGICASYQLRAHLTENFFTETNSDTPYFTFDGEINEGESKLSLHPTFAFGFKFGRVLFFFRLINDPFHSRDLSQEWNLQEDKTSYFYSSPYQQSIGTVCLGYIF
jgi:hypothetical protein